MEGQVNLFFLFNLYTALNTNLQYIHLQGQYFHTMCM